MKHNLMWKTLTVATALVLIWAVSCNERYIEIDSIEKELFLRESAEGIYKNGEPLFLYSAERHQKATNKRRVQYRIQTDEQDTCLNVTMEAIPENTGSYITTAIDYRSPGELISSMSLLECSRRTDRYIWLWNSSSLTGIILDIYRME